MMNAAIVPEGLESFAGELVTSATMKHATYRSDTLGT
jgi:hypothetical protein